MNLKLYATVTTMPASHKVYSYNTVQKKLRKMGKFAQVKKKLSPQAKHHWNME